MLPTVDHRGELAEMKLIRQKLPKETLQDDVVLDIDVEEQQSTYNHLSERSTRLFAGILGAYNETFLLGIAFV